MLRKRTRSHPKERNLISGAVSESYFHSDMLTQKQKTNSFLKVPGLFVGFKPRSSDVDSVRSPTSPLDFQIFSGFGTFRHHHPRSQNETQQMSWNRTKVGLSIIDSLDDDDETKEPGVKVIRASDNKNIILKRQLSVRSLEFCSHGNSLEAPITPVDAQKSSSDVLFEIGNPPFEPGMINEDFRSRSMDSGKYRSYLTDFGTRKSRLGSGNSVLENSKNIIGENNASAGTLSSILPSIGPVPVSEIEDSEDYTCVRTHGSNPKVTHIFGDQVFECDEVTGILMKIRDDDKTPEAGFGPSDDVLVSYQSDGFLQFCYNCKKRLDGEDIYMYRGEKAFCSSTCRSHEIEKEEEMEKTNNDSSGTFDSSSIGPEGTSKNCLFIAT